MKGKLETLAERFWAKVDKTSNCWLWTGSLNQGYGQILLEGRLVKAHRVAFFLEHERWPQPMALHACGNRQCVRHIYEGTAKDNYADMLRLNEGHVNTTRVIQTHCHRGHKYDLEWSETNHNRCSICAGITMRKTDYRRRASTYEVCESCWYMKKNCSCYQWMDRVK